MSGVTLKGVDVQLQGSFLRASELAPDFVLVNRDLETVTLETYKGKKKLIATVPSLDTPVCKSEAKKINDLALHHPDLLILVVSKDLPFRQKQICLDEKLTNIIVLSDIRIRSSFGKNYGVLIGDGPLEGLFARAILALDEHDKVIYSELVPEITEEPNLEEIFQSITAKPDQDSGS